ncbi:MAG: AAA family ATPase [Lachnospiraceae bacterium]|nr:AAA family ATPase [Lachnospiraceae bacterium]
MNINEAKEEIKRTIEIYLDKNEFGGYTIPVEKQRPVFMTGAPGIGKTAIMQQIAEELGIALVSYSMTHHTRQSALGLPVIETKEFNGKQFIVSEYTMSEIVASVYNVMEQSGKREGILFLDEINCVSETLAPAMLLFLQYKIFGNQQIPEGWVVVTAGNPPEYNKSVKEFDVATLDRLKCIKVEEDFGVWKQYAYRQGIHAAVISFLEINKQWFYSVQADVDGVQYVTARGWEDLSSAIKLYEKKDFDVSGSLIRQYITNTEVARKFTAYYKLHKKYQSSYQIKDILIGNIPVDVLQKSMEAKLDERFSVLGLFLDELNTGFRTATDRESILQMVVKSLRIVKKEIKQEKENTRKLPASSYINEEKQKIKQEMESQMAANSLSERGRAIYLSSMQILSGYEGLLAGEDADKDFLKVKKAFTKETKQHEKYIDKVKAQLENAFAFIEKAWGNSQEIVLFVTELTAGHDSIAFINQWGSDSYFRYNKELLIYSQHEKLSMEIEAETAGGLYENKIL